MKPIFKTYRIPFRSWHVDPRTGRTLLSAILKGRPNGGIDNTGNISRWMNEMKVLSTTLTNQPWKILIFAQIIAHFFPEMLEGSVM